MIHLVIRENGLDGNPAVLWASEEEPDWSKIDWPSALWLIVSVVADKCHVISNRQYDVYSQDDIDLPRVFAQVAENLKRAPSVRFWVNTPRGILAQRDGKALCRDVQYKAYKAVAWNPPPPDTYQVIAISNGSHCTVTRPFHSNPEHVAVEWEDMKAALRSFARDGYDLRLDAMGPLANIEEHIAEIEDQSGYYMEFIDVIHPGQMAAYLAELQAGNYDIRADDDQEPF